MKVIRVKELPQVTPPKHHNMVIRQVVDHSIGAKTMRVSFDHLESNGMVEAHKHEKGEKAYIVLKGMMVAKSERGEEVRTHAGEALLVYPGEVHSISAGDENTDYICVTGLHLPSAGSEIPAKKWK